MSRAAKQVAEDVVGLDPVAGFDIDASLRNKPAQAWLEGSTMKITPLN